MYSLKTATIVQIILLVLSLGFSVFYLIMFCVSIGLNGTKGQSAFPNAYEYISFFIGAVLILKLLLFRNNYVLPIGGLAVFAALIVVQCLRFKIIGWLGAGSTEVTYYMTLLLLLGNSIVYLVKAINVTKGKRISG
ncbi:MAG: hypothetical protein RR994_01730 [Clostridia bacterium]